MSGSSVRLEPRYLITTLRRRLRERRNGHFWSCRRVLPSPNSVVRHAHRVRFLRMPATRNSLPATPATLVVGAGRLGIAMAAGLREAGWPVVLVARGNASAARAAACGLAFVRSLGDAPAAGLVLLCVPDDAVSNAALALCDHPHLLSTSAVVLHTSGAVPVAALVALDALVAGTGSLHPLQTVTVHSSAGVLHGAPAAVSGDAIAIAMSERMCEALGLVPFRLADEMKPLHHAASAVAANFTVALLDVSIRLAVEAGMPTEAARSAFAALARSAVDRVADQPTEEALTGPIVRGDVGTVRAHLAALRRSAPEFLPLYIEAARCTLRLARRAGLDADAARTIAAALDDPVPS
ncbi:MAG: hypothetical protein C0497_12200 [Gemmatimonas sp.]|nr:hypothetical protein [Gemmatimonas sp.]